jgi:hypothetical protein
VKRSQARSATKKRKVATTGLRKKSSRPKKITNRPGVKKNQPARAGVRTAQSASATDGQPAGETPAGAPLKPYWDSMRRILFFGGLIVKWFRTNPAKNETAILAEFQRLGWPEYISDPLPAGFSAEYRKARLHDAIKSLNRRHQNSLIRFHGDGTGTRIRWERLN